MTTNSLQEATTLPDWEIPTNHQLRAYLKIMDRVTSNIFMVPGVTGTPLPLSHEYESQVEIIPVIVSHYPGPFAGTGAPLQAPGASSDPLGRAHSPASDTSNAINDELLRESALVKHLTPYVLEARAETFVDGMASAFGGRVCQSIVEHGSVAIAAWERVMERTDNAYETGEEMLRQIGLLEHAPSHGARLRVLTDSMRHEDPRIRDAAGLGLSFLDDASALPNLREAYSAESEPWLRANLEQVIAQLEDVA